MTRRFIGLLASVAFLSTGAAIAGGDKDKQATGGSGTEQTESTSTSGSMSSEGTGGSGQELQGTVVKAEGKTLYVDHMGMVVPLRVDSSTQFKDPAIKRAQDLKEGDKIRASFTVKNKTQNLATEISRESGTGGAGMDQPADTSGGAGESLPPSETGTPPPSDPGTAPGTGGSGDTPTEPGSDPGTGGSGMDTGTGGAGTTPDPLDPNAGEGASDPGTSTEESTPPPPQQ